MLYAHFYFVSTASWKKIIYSSQFWDYILIVGHKDKDTLLSAEPHWGCAWLSKSSQLTMVDKVVGAVLSLAFILLPFDSTWGATLTDREYNVVIAISEKSSDSITDYDAFLNSVKVSPMQNWYRRG